MTIVGTNARVGQNGKPTLVYRGPRATAVIYPDDAVLRTALRGAAAYGLSWFDAHLWAYAEVHGLSELPSEDFQHGRMYGTMTVRDPFLDD